MAERQTLLARDAGQGIQFADQRISAPSQAFGDFSGMEAIGQGMEGMARGLSQAAGAGQQIKSFMDQRDAESQSTGITNAANHYKDTVQNETQKLAEGYIDQDGVAHDKLVGPDLDAESAKVRNDARAVYEQAIEGFRKQNPFTFRHVYNDQTANGVHQMVEDQRQKALIHANVIYKVGMDEMNAITYQDRFLGDVSGFHPVEGANAIQKHVDEVAKSKVLSLPLKLNLISRAKQYAYSDLYSKAFECNPDALPGAEQAVKNHLLLPYQYDEIAQAYRTRMRLMADPANAKAILDQQTAALSAPGSYSALENSDTAKRYAMVVENYANVTTAATEPGKPPPTPAMRVAPILVPLMQKEFESRIKREVMPDGGFPQLRNAIQQLSDPNNLEGQKLVRQYVSRISDYLRTKFDVNGASPSPTIIKALDFLNGSGGALPTELTDVIRNKMKSEYEARSAAVLSGNANSIYENNPVIYQLRGLRDSAQNPQQRAQYSLLMSGKLADLQKADLLDEQYQNVIPYDEQQALQQDLSFTDDQHGHSAVNRMQSMVQNYGRAAVPSIINLLAHSESPSAGLMRIGVQLADAETNGSAKRITEAMNIASAALQWHQSPDTQKLLKENNQTDLLDRVCSAVLNMESYTEGGIFGTKIASSGVLRSMVENEKRPYDAASSPLMSAFRDEGTAGAMQDTFKKLVAYYTWGKPGGAANIYDAAMKARAVMGRAFVPVRTNGGFNPAPSYTVMTPSGGEDFWYQGRPDSFAFRSQNWEARSLGATLDSFVFGQGGMPRGSWLFNASNTVDQLEHFLFRTPFASPSFSEAPNLDTLLIPAIGQANTNRQYGSTTMYPLGLVPSSGPERQQNYLPADLQYNPEKLCVLKPGALPGEGPHPVYLGESAILREHAFPPAAKKAAQNYLSNADNTDPKSRAAQIFQQNYRATVNPRTGDINFRLASMPSANTTAGTLGNPNGDAQIYEDMGVNASPRFREVKMTSRQFKSFHAASVNSIMITGVSDSMPDLAKQYDIAVQTGKIKFGNPVANRGRPTLIARGATLGLNPSDGSSTTVPDERDAPTDEGTP